MLHVRRHDRAQREVCAVRTAEHIGQSADRNLFTRQELAPEQAQSQALINPFLNGRDINRGQHRFGILCQVEGIHVLGASRR